MDTLKVFHSKSFLIQNPKSKIQNWYGLIVYILFKTQPFPMLHQVRFDSVVLGENLRV
jgi:hypothetical protein